MEKDKKGTGLLITAIFCTGLGIGLIGYLVGVSQNESTDPRSYQIQLNDPRVDLYDGARLVGSFLIDTTGRPENMTRLDSLIYADNQ